jgi:hypothetical protein
VEERLQYTIEARELTNEYTHRPSYDVELRQRTIEADDQETALFRFVREEQSELVSVTRPGNGQGESIATVKKEDTVFLVRVYPEG